MPELKPCPFCGDALELRTVARDWYRVEHPDNDACPLGGNDYTYAQTAQGLKTLLTDWSQRHIPAGQVLVPRRLLETIEKSWRIPCKKAAPLSDRAELAIAEGLQELRAILKSQLTAGS